MAEMELENKLQRGPEQGPPGSCGGGGKTEGEEVERRKGWGSS